MPMLENPDPIESGASSTPQKLLTIVNLAQFSFSVILIVLIECIVSIETQFLRWTDLVR